MIFTTHSIIADFYVILIFTFSFAAFDIFGKP